MTSTNDGDFPQLGPQSELTLQQRNKQISHYCFKVFSISTCPRILSAALFRLRQNVLLAPLDPELMENLLCKNQHGKRFAAFLKQ